MGRQLRWLNPDRYGDTETVAAMLGVCVRTLKRRIAAGVIPPPTHPGRPNRFEFGPLLEHVERTDRSLSCQIAGEIARLRAYRAQGRKLGMGLPCELVTDERGDEWMVWRRERRAGW